MAYGFRVVLFRYPVLIDSRYSDYWILGMRKGTIGVGGTGC